jgi:hypothetical protein
MLFVSVFVVVWANRGLGTPLTIHQCPPSDRLPVGRTCFRRIDLPDYQDPGVLREKLLLALATMDGSGTGVIS